MNTALPKVFAPQESWSTKIDLSSLQRYGNIVTLLPVSQVIGMTPGPSYRRLEESLHEQFRPGNDYLMAFPGDPAAPFLLGVACERLGYMRQGIKWLRWERERSLQGDRRGGFYVNTLIRVE